MTPIDKYEVIKSGVYVVQLLNEHLIGTNASDGRRAQTCAKVNKDNVKFGKAKDLFRRQGSYRRNFGSTNVMVRSEFVLYEFADEIERMMKIRFKNHRILWNGRRLEWLYGVTVDEVWNELQTLVRKHK